MAQSRSRPQSNWVGHTIAGRYKIEAVLGRGGMSTVYKAIDPNLRRAVAVKLIHPHLSSDPQFVRRFEQEAAAVAQLRHPNIIQVYDFAHDGDIYYMVLEYVPGETLQAKLKTLNATNQRLPLAQTIQIMTTTCEAVAYAHEGGMIHRDLKPANVMLNSKMEPILMDFGVAKMLGSTQHTATGTVVGTAKYMSPEQARGEHPDERADIYSLGVMLYEMTTGQPPFDGGSAISIMMKHVNEPVPDVRQIQSSTPDQLVAVIRKALAKSPADRFQTAGEMGAALSAITLGAKPVAAAAPAKAREDTDPSGLRMAPPTLMPAPAASAVRPAQRIQKSGIPLWLIGMGAAVLLLLFGLGVAFAISRFVQPSGGEGEQAVTSSEGQAVASAEEELLPSSDRMVRINAGTYTVGTEEADGEHISAQQVKLDEFWIDQYEVTNAQYAAFLAETDNQPPASWAEGTMPAEKENHPVEGVTWNMATAYCNWAQKRLPTEAEWEVAARGPQGLLYPWGDDERAVELPRAGTYEVGSIAANRSPFGLFDMAGNVWEWVDEPYAPVKAGNRVLHGGAHGFLQDMAYRLQGDPGVPTMSATAGFRCAADKVRAADTNRVLFSDAFTDPESGWPVVEEGTNLFGYHPPDYYHVEVSVPGDFAVVTRQPDFDNVSVESDMFVAKTGPGGGDFRYGLAVRRSGDNFYAFTISPRTKTWYVLKSSASGLKVLTEGKNDSIQGLSQETPDVMNVNAVGDRFIFHINGQPVAQINDADYASGEVGFYVETFDESLAHIHYDSLTIREADAGEVGVVHAEGVLSFDDFSDPNSGWPELAEGTNLFGYHPPAFYHVEVSAPNKSGVVTRGPALDDVTVESDMFVAKTGPGGGDFRYGLAVRRSGDNFYAFTISPRTKTWYVLKSSASGLKVLTEGKNDSIQGLKEDTADTLRVDAEGANFAFHINDQVVTQVSDPDYASGEVGFYVETFDESMAHIHYNSLTVREVEFEAMAAAPESTTATPTPTSAVISDIVAAPTSEPTAASSSPTPAPVPEGMVLVPAGYFQMGSSTGQPDETPEHPVLLDAFLMDKFEVSNAQYRACVDDSGCTSAAGPDRGDNFPVTGVNWDQANAYCKWAGKRLPTEAEWEYAASGPENLTWPWGNSFDPNLSAASAPDAQPVDSFPEGASPFGVFNMAGNVAEWVADVFNEDFYANSPASNPLSSGRGAGRIFRGGSFDNLDGSFYTTSRRYGNVRTFQDVDVGFRCAQDAPPGATQPNQREELVAEFCQVFTAFKPGAPCP